MPKRKAACNCNIKPWCSALPSCKEKSFLQIGASIFESAPFLELTYGAQMLYFHMANESKGHQNFQFPLAVAKKRGFNSSSLRRHVKELKEAGFIEVQSNANLRKPNDYSFTYGWKPPE